MVITTIYLIVAHMSNQFLNNAVKKITTSEM